MFNVFGTSMFEMFVIFVISAGVVLLFGTILLQIIHYGRKVNIGGFLSFLCGILFPQKKRSLAYVVSKASTLAYSQIISFQEASVWSTLPHPLFFPESWWVRVEILDQLVNISVEREVYNSVSEGDIVIAEYVRERFSGHIRLKEIYPM